LTTSLESLSFSDRVRDYRVRVLRKNAVYNNLKVPTFFDIYYLIILIIVKYLLIDDTLNDSNTV
jgi:hypothetical protein